MYQKLSNTRKYVLLIGLTVAVLLIVVVTTNSFALSAIIQSGENPVSQRAIDTSSSKIPVNLNEFPRGEIRAEELFEQQFAVNLIISIPQQNVKRGEQMAEQLFEQQYVESVVILHPIRRGEILAEALFYVPPVEPVGRRGEEMARDVELPKAD